MATDPPPRQADQGGWGNPPQPGSLPPPPNGTEAPSSFPPPPGGGQGGGQQGGAWQGGGQQGWGQPGSGQPGFGAPPERNGTALASMIAGIVSLVCLLLFIFIITIPIAVVAAIAALVTGVLGLRASRREGAGGRGQAIAGLVTGSVTLGLLVLVTVIAIAAWNSLGFETSPFSDPEGFIQELEDRGIEVDEEGNVDLEELQRQLEEEQGPGQAV